MKILQIGMGNVAGFGFRALVAQDEIRFFDCRGTGILRFRFHDIEFDEDCEDNQGESEDEDRIEKFELFLSRRGPFLFLLFFSVFGEERFEGLFDVIFPCIDLRNYNARQQSVGEG